MYLFGRNFLKIAFQHKCDYSMASYQSGERCFSTIYSIHLDTCHFTELKPCAESPVITEGDGASQRLTDYTRTKLYLALIHLELENTT
jgi:hypothetical protein